MTNGEYRDRFVHEFDEDIDEYESRVQDEAAYAVDTIDDEEFIQEYSQLPDTDDPHVALEDDEAMTGYRHIANGEWEKLDLGQVISLYRLANMMQGYSRDTPQKHTYQHLQQATDELNYVLTLESEFQQVEENYTQFDE